MDEGGIDMSIVLQGSWETGTEGWLDDNLTDLYTGYARQNVGARTGSWRLGLDYGAVHYPLPTEASNALITAYVWAMHEFTLSPFDVAIELRLHPSQAPIATGTATNIPGDGVYRQVTFSHETGGENGPLYLTIPANNYVIVDDWYIEIEPLSTTSTFAKHSGVWKPAEKYVKHDGIWKPAETKVRHGGIWKDV